MQFYPIPMVPGPVRVPEAILAACHADFGSADLEPEFLDLYNRAETALQSIMGTTNPVAIMSGEGMLALWGALKSCIQPGDRVLSIATGVFGYGVADMAKAIGALVNTIELPYDHTIHDWVAIEQAAIDFQPKMIAVIHCETPSGTLNPLEELGSIKRRQNIPLLYVDVVASLAGSPVRVDEWGIDLALGASQKALSAPPGMSFISVSPPAWEVIQQVDYQGYDALLPWRTAQRDFYFPYTHTWHGVAALYTAAEILFNEGLENSFKRHDQAALACRAGILELGLELYPDPTAIPSPTVTAVKVPAGTAWNDLDRRFRQHGLVVGGSYGPLTGKVFRLGHMGSQADLGLVHQALEAIKRSL